VSSRAQLDPQRPQPGEEEVLKDFPAAVEEVSSLKEVEGEKGKVDHTCRVHVICIALSLLCNYCTSSTSTYGRC